MTRAFTFKLIGSCLVTVGFGMLGGLVDSGGEWYAALEKPAGNPPSWVFGPVWTVLYLMMGVSLALLWHRAPQTPGARRALIAFGIQFTLNLLWTPVFFGMHQIGAALGVIVVMWLAIGATVLLAWRVSRPAAWLLMPYWLWVSFATYLNAAFLVLNR